MDTTGMGDPHRVGDKHYRFLMPEDVTLLYVNFGYNGVSLVFLDHRTGRVIETDAQPYEVVGG